MKETKTKSKKDNLLKYNQYPKLRIGFTRVEVVKTFNHVEDGESSIESWCKDVARHLDYNTLMGIIINSPMSDDLTKDLSNLCEILGFHKPRKIRKDKKL